MRTRRPGVACATPVVKLNYFGAQPVLPDAGAGAQLVLPEAVAGAQLVLAGFFFAAHFFLAAQQPVFGVQLVLAAAGAQPVLPAQAATAGAVTEAAATTTDAPTTFFRVLVREVDFISSSCKYLKGISNTFCTCQPA